MRMRSLGEGGPDVSVVGLGTNNFGGRIDYDQSLAVIEAALDAGITLFDTADIYGPGTSEEFIGRALEELVEEGKVRYLGSSNFSAEQIEAAGTRFVSAQNHYSLVEREVEDEILPVCER